MNKKIKKLFSQNNIVTGIFLLIFAIHFLKIAEIIPIESLKESSYLASDYYLNDSIAVLKDKAFREAGESGYGYDPFLMAGYVALDGLHADRRFLVFMVRLFRWGISPDRLSKILIFLCLLMGPVLLFFSVRLFGGDTKTALLGMALGVAGFMNYEPVSRFLVQRANYSFILSTYLSVFTTSLFYKGLQSKRNNWLFLFSLFLSLTFFVHSSSLVIMLIPMMWILWSYGRTMSLKKKCLTVACLCFPLLANLTWLSALSGLLDYYSLEFDKDFVTRIKNLIYTYVPIRENQFVVVLLRGYVTLAAVVGLWPVVGKKNSSLAFLFTVWVVWVGIVGFTGSSIGWMNSLSPKKFLWSFFIVQIIPASWLISHVFLKQKSSRIIFFLVILWFQMTWQIPQGYGLRRLKEGFSAHVNLSTDKLVNVIKKLPKEGRILIEDEASVRSTQLVAPFTKHSILGVPSPYVDAERRELESFSPPTNYSPPFLFGEPLYEYSRAELLKLLDVYDIRYVFVFSEPSRIYFEKFKTIFNLVPIDVEEIPAASLFERRKFKSNLFLNGSGEVSYDYNRIFIKNASPGEIVLKFHWAKILKTTSGLPVKPVDVSPFSAPFIHVDNSAGKKEIFIKPSF